LPTPRSNVTGAHLDVDGYTVKVLTMKEPPASTFRQHAAGPVRCAGHVRRRLEWRRRPEFGGQEGDPLTQRHFFNKRVSLVNT